MAVSGDDCSLSLEGDQVEPYLEEIKRCTSNEKTHDGLKGLAQVIKFTSVTSSHQIEFLSKVVVLNDCDDHISVYPDLFKSIFMKSYYSKNNKFILDDPIAHSYMKSL